GGLGFGQSGSRHNTRVLRVSAVSVFRTSPVFPTGCGPLRLSPSGKLGDPEVCSSVPPSSVRRIRLSVMWRTIWAIQLSPYRAGLARRHGTRLPVSPAFPTGSCPLWLSPSGQSMTQESPFELLLTVSRMQHRVPRRTVSLQAAQALPTPLAERGDVTSNTCCDTTFTIRAWSPRTVIRWESAPVSVATAVICLLSLRGCPRSLVRQDQTDVSPLSRGVMLPVGATPIAG